MLRNTYVPNLDITYPASNGPGYAHPELVHATPEYQVIRDCIAGETVVKSKREKYLPIPNAELLKLSGEEYADDRKDVVVRYNSYINRATFYNVVKRTLNGLLGHVFTRDPVYTGPDRLQEVMTDVTGEGVSINQLAKKACKYTLAYSRAGLLVDFPKTTGLLSIAEAETLHPSITAFAPWDIINWRTEVINGRSTLTMVVLREQYTQSDDGFKATKGVQLRELRLIDGVATVQLWRSNDTQSNFVRHGARIVPTDASGATLGVLPFSFIGTEHNDSAMESPLLFDMASLNIAHYRNSADYEEAVFVVGQPTPVFTGLTESWLSEQLGGKVMLGSRAAVPLPVNANASLLQVKPNSMAFEAMLHKEKQMVALGAKLVESKAVQRTATEVTVDTSAETSTLATTATNVAAAITASLKLCARYLGMDHTNISYSLHTAYDLASLSSEERRQLILEWQAGMITFEETRDNLRRAGIASAAADEAKKDILSEIDEFKDIRATTMSAQQAPSDPGVASN